MAAAMIVLRCMSCLLSRAADREAILHARGPRRRRGVTLDFCGGDRGESHHGQQPATPVLLERERSSSSWPCMRPRRVRARARSPRSRARRESVSRRCSPRSCGARATAACACSSARGGELERDFGYGVVRQLFDAPLVAMSPRQRARSWAAPPGWRRPRCRSAARPGRRGRSGLGPARAVLAVGEPGDRAAAADRGRRCALGRRRLDRVSVLPRAPRRRARAAGRLRHARRRGRGERCRRAPSPRSSARRCARRAQPSARRPSSIARLLGSAGSRRVRARLSVATGGNPFLLQRAAARARRRRHRARRQSSGRVEQIAPDDDQPRDARAAAAPGPDAMQLAFAIAVLGKSAELRHAAALAGLDLARRRRGRRRADERRRSCATGARWSSSIRSCARPSTPRSAAAAGGEPQACGAAARA